MSMQQELHRLKFLDFYFRTYINGEMFKATFMVEFVQYQTELSNVVSF